MKRLFLVFLSTILSMAVILPSATVAMADSEKEEKNRPIVKAALTIRAPDKAERGQPVTITVFGKHNHQTVSKAEIYAMKADKMANTADTKNYTTMALDYAALSDDEGIFLGETNNEGKLTCRFADSGNYILIAFKPGHIPGFSRITITPSATKRLEIKVPDSAETGKPVTIAVVEHGTSQNVTKAGLYALRLGDISTSRPLEKPDKMITALKPIIAIPEISVNAEAIKGKGIFIGYTDDKGLLVYSFNKTGSYVLLAVKDGYLPDVARIQIRPKK